MRPSTTPMGLRPRPEERVDARTPSVWTRIELQRSRLQTQQAKGLLDFRDAAEQPHLFPGAAARGTLLLPKPGAAPRRASAAAPLNVHHPRAHHATQAHHALKPQRAPISAASMFETLATRYAGRAGGAPQVRSLPAAVAAARAANTRVACAPPPDALSLGELVRAGARGAIAAPSAGLSPAAVAAISRSSVRQRSGQSSSTTARHARGAGLAAANASAASTSASDEGAPWRQPTRSTSQPVRRSRTTRQVGGRESADASESSASGAARLVMEPVAGS